MWSCRSDALRPKVLERFQAARLRHLLADREVWTTPELASAALWAPPKRWKTTLRQDLDLARTLLHPRLLVRAPLILPACSGSSASTRRGPRTGISPCSAPTPPPRGTVSARRCWGPCSNSATPMGSAPTWIVPRSATSTSTHAPHGFRVTSELRLPRGPKMWAMWREARR